MMKKIFSVILLITVCTQAFSQPFFLNNDMFFKYDIEKYILTKEDAHTAIKYHILDDYSLVDSLKKSTKPLIPLLRKNLRTLTLQVSPLIYNFAGYNYEQKKADLFSINGIKTSLFNKKWAIELNTGFFSSNINKNPKLLDTASVYEQVGQIIKNNKLSYSLFTEGYVNFRPKKYIILSTGKYRHFFGEGYRSLLLSDFASAYPYFQATLRLWKIKYIYRISFLKDRDIEAPQDKLFNKYAITHYLSMNLIKNKIDVLLFETIVQSSRDSLGLKRGLDVNYINPVIFFRPVEFYLGSPDNVLVGGGLTLRPLKKVSLYTQLVLDEFYLSHIKQNPDWWGNKYGIQAGIKAFDFMNIKNLFVRAEYNKVRPYTYSHASSIRNYGYLYQPLAHYAGANFVEKLAQLSYRYRNIRCDITAGIIAKGFDIENDTVNYGGNIYRSYKDRKDDFGIAFLQGNVITTKSLNIKLIYLLDKQTDASVVIYFDTKKNNTDINWQHNIGIGFKTALYPYF